MKTKFTFLVSLILLFFLANSINAQQPLSLPDLSQEAKVMQRIGLTDITVSYHRPAIKGREVWGKLVPYNTVWRAGANENTTITFSDDVKIAGKTVPAGSYGLHMIPTEKEWTIILNKFSKGWGSFGYREEDDFLRFKAIPVSSEEIEYLNYMFETSEPMRTTLVMHWEKLKVPIEIEVDVHTIVVKKFEESLRGLNQFFWQPHNQAAAYCVNNKTHLDKASEWVDKSIRLNRNFSNLATKSRLAELNGNHNEAEALMNEALTLANEAEINNYGYMLLQNNQIDKAISVFKMNVEKYPESWNAYDSLAEGYMNKGETDLAIEYYNKALKMVQDDTQKKRINDTLKVLASN